MPGVTSDFGPESADQPTPAEYAPIAEGWVIRVAGTDADVPLVWWIRGAVALVFALILVDVLDWTAGIDPLAQVYPDWPAMAPWSAGLLAMLGIAVWLQSGRPSPRSVWIGRALAMAAGALGVVFLGSHAVEQTIPAGPTVQTALSVVALAVAVALLKREGRRIGTAWSVSVLAAAALPLVALVTYLFDAAQMLSGSPPFGMNAATAVAIVLLVDAAVAARPDRQPVAWLVARSDRRMLVRLVVTFALVPIWVAIWRLILLGFGLRGNEVWVLSVTLATLILGIPFFLISRRVQRLMSDQLAQSRAREEAERQRAQAVERYRILADNAVDIVAHLRGTVPTWLSPSIEAAFGWPADVWTGADFVPRIHPDDLDDVFAALGRIEDGRSAVERFRIATAGGGYRWVEGHGKPYTDVEGSVDGVIVSLRVIDTQVEVELELERALDYAIALAGQKSDYVATVSHEIRSPIHAILGFAELLENQLSTEGRNEAAEWSRRVRMEAERLTRLIADLLDLSRLDAGRTTIAAEPFQLRAMVDEVIEMSRLKAEEDGLQLGISVDPTISDWRTGDADRLHQVLRNLVSNATKFTREGRVDLEISGVDETSTDLIRFAVTDTGPGIPGEDIARIMEPFAQVWGSDAERGSGLGLAISDRLVKAMGGDGLQVASLEGHGSTFYFTVPLPEAKPPEQASVSAPIPSENNTRRTILVVDDNPTNRLLVETQLQKLGYDCASAADGHEALERLETQGFDVVLMDCNMPGMDGYETTRRIRAAERGTGLHIPILALTASTVGSNRDACERAGMDGFLGKPLLSSTLAAEISRFVGAGRPHDATGRRDTDDQRESATEAGILDEARIERMTEELGTEPLQKVVAAFVAELPRRLAELRQVAADGDIDAVRRSAHAIRSPSAMLGAVTLAERLRAVEESADPVAVMAQTGLEELVDASITCLQARVGRLVNQGGSR